MQEARQMLEMRLTEMRGKSAHGRKEQQCHTSRNSKTGCKGTAHAGLCRRYVLTVIFKPEQEELEHSYQVQEVSQQTSE